MNVLIVEDDDQKLGNIQDFIKSRFEIESLLVSRSFHSGLKAIVENQKKLDLVLLDMSMPSYDISSHEPSGGKPKSFAGKEFLAQMKLRSIMIPTIVITMFESFSTSENQQLSIEQLGEELNDLYSPYFLDIIYYTSRETSWQVKLNDIISKVL